MTVTAHGNNAKKKVNENIRRTYAIMAALGRPTTYRMRTPARHHHRYLASEILHIFNILIKIYESEKLKCRRCALPDTVKWRMKANRIAQYI